MLGRLAKWLRILGFDVLFFSKIDDRQVMQIGRQQQRTILTRDTHFAGCKAAGDVFFIKSDHIFQQLEQMKEILDLHDPDRAERCITCNGLLLQVAERIAVRDLVPDYVYHTFERFTRCRDCGKVYWEGSHYENIRVRIRETLSEDDED